ncbi:hypothetical protein JHK87_020091 [Glycine soja]|nr:hypothetical protein JHK87_020091 [Glycine soja]
MAGQSKIYSNVAISAVNQVHLFVEEEDSLATPTFEVVVTIKSALLDFPSQLIKTVSKFEMMRLMHLLLFLVSFYSFRLKRTSAKTPGH